MTATTLSVMAVCTVCVAGVCALPGPDSQGEVSASQVKALGDRTLTKDQ